MVSYNKQFGYLFKKTYKLINSKIRKLKRKYCNCRHDIQDLIFPRNAIKLIQENYP